MTGFSVLVVLCGVAAVILTVIFLIRLITKKSKKWIGLSALFCVVGIIVFSIIGSHVWLASMTPDEHETYYAEQREAERLAKEQTGDADNEIIKTGDQTEAPEPTEAPTSLSVSAEQIEEQEAVVAVTETRKRGIRRY